VRSVFVISWALVPFSLFLFSQASAVEVTDLYSAQTIVTGTASSERLRGLRVCLSDVVVKLTGDASILMRDDLESLLARAPSLVAALELEDRMKGIPVHDEQGTRERPHYLRIRFEKDSLNAELDRMGLRLWSADRPRLGVWLGVQTTASGYIVSDKGDRGYAQRAVLKETAERRGVPIALPDSRVADNTVSFTDVATGAADKLSALLPGATVMLTGTLVLGESGYWDNRWSLHLDGYRHEWSMRGVTFDSAIREGIQRSAAILSGVERSKTGAEEKGARQKN